MQNVENLGTEKKEVLLQAKPKLVEISPEMRNLLDLIVEDLVHQDLARLRIETNPCAGTEMN